MGKATIVSGGTDGLYTVKLDYGKAQKDAAIARINARLAVLAEEIPAATIKLSTQQAIEDAQKVVVEQAISAFVTVTKTLPRNEANVAKALQDHGKEAAKLMEEKGKTGPLRLALEILKDEQAGLQRELDRWQAIEVEEEREAWCADFTEDATGSVATIDVPGESAQILIAPSAPDPTSSDGQLVAREVQTPGQVFWNAAVLPGWQMHMPTFRVGVITVMNPDETANVTLDEAKSSAQKLGINSVTELESVPIEYMDCNATVFEVGDHVVVQFDDRDWAKPKIVGFASNPKACGGGFVFRPTNDVTTIYSGANHRYWGKPFTPANEPLGTPFGSSPFVALQPKLVGGAPSAQIKRVRGIDGDKYGQIDWQGVNPVRDVLSWSAQSWDTLTFGVSGAPVYRWNQWEGNNVNDYEKSRLMVQRMRNMGAGNAVYSKLRVIKVFDSGLVDGACYSTIGGARSLVAVLRDTTQAGTVFTFVKSGSPDVPLGAYTAPVNTVNLHGWYFNRSGTRARCTFASKDDWYSVEAALTGSGVTFSEIGGSRSTSSSEDWFYRTEHFWNPPIAAGANNSTRSMTLSGSMMDRSPALVADYQGDVGVIAYLRKTVYSPPTHTATYVSSGAAPDGSATEAFTQSSSNAGVKLDLVIVTDGGAEEVIPIWMDSEYADSVNVTQHKTIVPFENGYKTTLVEELSTTRDATYRAVKGYLVDVDVRASAVARYAYMLAPGSASYYMSVEGNPGYEAYNPEIYQATWTVPKNKAELQMQSGAATAATEIYTWSEGEQKTANYSGPANGTSGAPNWFPMSPITLNANPGSGERCLGLVGWLSFYHASAFDLVNGAVRCYYGQAVSTTLVSVGGFYESIGEDPASKPLGCVSHILGAGGSTDAAALALIQDQSLPWLAKLGVY